MVSGRVVVRDRPEGGGGGRADRRRGLGPVRPRGGDAERLGVTLVGFLRGDGFNVYSHDRRIDLRDLTGWGLSRADSGSPARPSVLPRLQIGGRRPGDLPLWRRYVLRKHASRSSSRVSTDSASRPAVQEALSDESQARAVWFHLPMCPAHRTRAIDRTAGPDPTAAARAEARARTSSACERMRPLRRPTLRGSRHRPDLLRPPRSRRCASKPLDDRRGGRRARGRRLGPVCTLGPAHDSPTDIRRAWSRSSSVSSRPTWRPHLEVVVSRPVRGVIDSVFEHAIQRPFRSSPSSSRHCRGSNNSSDGPPRRRRPSGLPTSSGRDRSRRLQAAGPAIDRHDEVASPLIRGLASHRLSGIDLDAVVALRTGAPWPGDAIVWVRIEGDRVELLEGPPRGYASIARTCASESQMGVKDLDPIARRGSVFSASGRVRRPESVAGPGYLGADGEARVRVDGSLIAIPRCSDRVIIASLGSVRYCGYFARSAAMTADRDTGPARPASLNRPGEPTPAPTSPPTSGRPAARPRPGGDVAHARQRPDVGHRLRLLVERRSRSTSSTSTHEADRHQPRATMRHRPSRASPVRASSSRSVPPARGSRRGHSPGAR